MSPSTVNAVVVLLLIALGIFSFPILLGFLAGKWEKRLVWPYVPSLPPGPKPDLSDPYSPPSQVEPVRITDYAKAVNQEAGRRGFLTYGHFFDGKGKIYKLRYDFWLAPDKMVLAMVGGGTMAGIPLQATWMYTRLQDGRSIVTIDDPKAADSDPTGMTDQLILANADFAELLERHRQRIAAALPPAIPYSESDALADHRNSRSARADALVEMGLAKYLDDQNQWYKYTVKGAFLAAVRASLREWRRAIRHKHRDMISRPGQRGYMPSGSRGSASARWRTSLKLICWVLLLLGLFTPFPRGPARNQAQLLFGTVVPLIAGAGLILLWVLRPRRSDAVARDDEEAFLTEFEEPTEASSGSKS
jgi:hypothetical protein